MNLRSVPLGGTDVALTFIDLFAGIGGIRLGMESTGAKCIMTSEIDKYARMTYAAYFQDNEEHVWIDDITSVSPEAVPDHDVLCGGFPCQPFSIAGVSKKNALGRAHGFDDPTKGTLFFNIKEILREKRPRAFLLENVKNLKGHDKGRTWRVIEQSLNEVGYNFSAEILDSSEVVPQHRERVFIVGLHRDSLGLLPEQTDFSQFWRDVKTRLQAEKNAIKKAYKISGIWPRVSGVLDQDVPRKYELTPNLWQYLQDYKIKHQLKGNGFGYSLFQGHESYTRTISARYYKDGSEVLIHEPGWERPRRLTPRECARLQGFPPDFLKMYGTSEQPVSDMQAYKQFGNSVSVPVIAAIAKEFTPYILGEKTPDIVEKMHSGQLNFPY